MHDTTLQVTHLSFKGTYRIKVKEWENIPCKHIHRYWRDYNNTIQNEHESKKMIRNKGKYFKISRYQKEQLLMYMYQTTEPQKSTYNLT